MKISRRNFLKATAAGIGASSAIYINPEWEALAASDTPSEIKYSHCMMCNHGPHCGIKAVVKEGKIMSIEYRDGYPNSNLCSKGVASIQEMYDPHRLLYPQKRTTPKGSPDPKWERISWDEALKTIADKLNEIKAREGAEKVMFFTGDPKEPRSAVQRLAFNFGSPNMGTESSTCFKATELSRKLIYGPEWFVATSNATGGMPNPKHTKVAIFWGTNKAWSGAFIMDRLIKAKQASNGNCKYIVIDPRVTPTVTALADLHIQLRPGTDGALALCFGNHLIQNNAYDKDFIRDWAHGFDEYKEYVKEFTIERTAEICGVDVSVIQKACDILVEQGAPITFSSAAAFPHHKNGVNTYRAMQLLIPLTGSLDVPGGFGITDEPFMDKDEWWGSMTFSGAKDLLPKLDHLRVDRKYFPVWADTDQQGSVQLNMMPEYVETGAIKAIVMFGGNAMMWPQTHLYQKAFADAELSVACDISYRPWTHDHCDILLPVNTMFERMAPLTIFGRSFFLREPIVESMGESRSDYRICCDLGTALGMGDKFWGGGPKSEEECMRDILKNLDIGVTLEDLRAASPNPVKVPMKDKPKFKKYELGLCRVDGKKGFSSPTTKVEFTSEILRKYGFNPLPIYVEPAQSPVSTPEIAKEYPLIMNAGSRVPMYTHSKQRDIPWLRELMPDPICGISKIAADERGIKDGDDIILSTQFGELKAKASITNMVRPDTIDMVHGWASADINELIPRDFDPISAFPPYKEGLCQVRKV